MAIMIPNTPREFDPASQEGLMFEALSRLPDEYYIFHSLRITSITDNTLHESEIDFVVFSRSKGIVVVEAKSGMVKYADGYWYYANGIPMHNGGPFTQASTNKYKLLRLIEQSVLSDIIKRCKMLHAVWFPSVSDSTLRTMTLPPEADRKIILTKEALDDPTVYIERVLSIELPNHIRTDLSEYEEKKIIRDILCPRFNVFPTASFERDLKQIVFHRLLREQSAILNFLSEQRTAVINGVAGTGKTMIAVEKAQRHARSGEKVLFLCYNNELKKYLEEVYPNNNIYYYTISGLACKYTCTDKPDYAKFKLVLEDMYLAGSFPYQHVIVDEGQDFGIDAIEEADLLQLIQDIIVDNDSDNKSFYVFYDRLQLIQAREMPRYIVDSDCKLTLYKNCRNTENIAKTSLSPIWDRKPMLFEGCVKGSPALMHYCENNEIAVSCIDRIINTLVSERFSDIVILTCKTETSSILFGKTPNGLYRNKYRFTTCRKFKGLEADAIVLIDVDNESFNAHSLLVYYVGTSRARLRLEIVSELSKEECTTILRTVFHSTSRIHNPMRELSSALNAIGIIEV